MQRLRPMMRRRGEPRRSSGPGRDSPSNGSAGGTAIPLARVEIDGRPYRVFPATQERPQARGGGGGNGSAWDDRGVGELSVGEGRYIIVPLEVCPPTNHAEARASKPLDVLTRRELQVVMLVAEGRVNKQIADRLRISEWTVSSHLRRIFAKLSVDSRAALVYRCSDLIHGIRDGESVAVANPPQRSRLTGRNLASR
jgi:DNA-binding CsgD family transcriptional regulator